MTNPLANGWATRSPSSFFRACFRLESEPTFFFPLSTNKSSQKYTRYTPPLAQPLALALCRLALQCGHSRERSRCLLLRIRFGPRAAAVLAACTCGATARARRCRRCRRTPCTRCAPARARRGRCRRSACNGRAAARAARRGRCCRSPCRTCVPARARTCRPLPSSLPAPLSSSLCPPLCSRLRPRLRRRLCRRSRLPLSSVGRFRHQQLHRL